MADQIDFRLIGDDLQAVIITLDPGEMVIAEAGAMMYMQDGIVMNTTLDPNAQVQYHGKFASAQPSTAAEFITLLRVGCAPITASASNTNGVWSVLVGDRTVTIGASGIRVQ